MPEGVANPPPLANVVFVGGVVTRCAAFAQSAGSIESVDIEGRLIDDKEKLLRFLGLQHGVPFDAKLQQRIADDLSKQLGYHLVEARIDTGEKGVKLHLVVKPARVVRNLRVHGNWPLFDDEIIRHPIEALFR